MEAQHCLSVVVGCPSFLRQLPSGPCLILDADRSSLENFCSEQALSEHPSPVAFQQVVLSDSRGEELTWRRFTDHRFNGPWKLSDFHHDYPNLQELETVNVQGQTLADVLEKQPILQECGSKFALIIRQGDPLRALMGAETWLHRCTSIALRGVDVLSSGCSSCELFLSSNGFSLYDKDNLSIWKPQVVEISTSYLVKLERAVSILLEQFSYKVLHSGLRDASTGELLAYWLAGPPIENVARELLDLQKHSLRQFHEIPEEDPCLQALNALFPFQYYRSLRPDLAHFNDRHLLEHFCTAGLKEGIRLEDGVEMKFAVRALRHVFPYRLYRALCPDLSGLNDQSLLLHFCQKGFEQDVDLSEESVKNFSGSFPISETQILKERIKELEQYLDLSRKQIAELREAIMNVPKNSLEQW